MSDTEEHSEAYNFYLELGKPTAEDFKRVFTQEELKELCLKHKLSVDMYRWNIVNDYRITFTEKGRYERWSESKRLGMLAKAVNKMKPSVLYDEDEIKRIRKEEWGIQLKENILSLNYWKREKSKKQQPLLLGTENGNTGSDNPAPEELLKESENVPEYDKEVELELNFNTDSMDCADSESSIVTVILSEQQENKAPETLNSEEVAHEINNIYSVNTTSITIDSQMSPQSQNFPMKQSQDVPTTYDNFENIIPLTSTQSQDHKTQDI